MFLSPGPVELDKILPHGCPICGSTKFSFQEVLWKELVDEWQLSPKEVQYINIQQGLSCTGCQNNLRSMTLARAICRSQNFSGILQAWVNLPSSSACKILEINEAGLLTKHLDMLPTHTLIKYPDYNIHNLPYPDGCFDLIIHSDTLEHVNNPVHAISECRRVLKKDGVLAFTIPIIVDRLSRSRAGLPPSYHGTRELELVDYDVKTEFGADAWKVIIEAGFESLEIYTDLFPASVAFTARK